MTMYALGTATKNGMEIIANSGEKIKVKATPVGKMYQPDPTDFEQTFVSLLQPDDIVLSPSGSTNRDYMSRCAQHCRVDWIHQGTLATLMGNGKTPAKTTTRATRSIPRHLLRIYQADPVVFYQYLPTDSGIDQLRILVQDWLALERMLVRDTNTLSQIMQRQRLLTWYGGSYREWAKRWGEFVASRFRRQISSFGAKLKKDAADAMVSTVTQHAADLYERYYGVEGQRSKNDRLALIQQRLDFFGCGVQLDHARKEVEGLLETLPENNLFDGLISAGALRARAFTLSYMRNPLLYQNVRALLAYAGFSVHDGQAIRRRHGQAASGNPSFKRAMVFDFAEKYWQNDTVGFFSALYYSYKARQVLMYWDLIELTEDVFKFFGAGVDDEDEAAGDEEVLLGGSATLLKHFIDRARGLDHLPILDRGTHIRAELKRLSVQQDPNRKEVWRVFSRGGLNLQMTRERIEQQTKRMLGVVLTKAVYYRWLTKLGMPLPLDQDRIYLAQYADVMDTDEPPTGFDIEIPAMFYDWSASRMREKRGASLPADVEFRLVPPDNRGEFLTNLSAKDLRVVFDALAKDERPKYLELLPLDKRGVVA